jgi:hypothetical protein
MMIFTISLPHQFGHIATSSSEHIANIDNSHFSTKENPQKIKKSFFLPLCYIYRRPFSRIFQHRSHPTSTTSITSVPQPPVALCRCLHYRNDVATIRFLLRIDELVEGIDQLVEGIDQLVEGIDGLVEGIDEDGRNVNAIRRKK